MKKGLIGIVGVAAGAAYLFGTDHGRETKAKILEGLEAARERVDVVALKKWISALFLSDGDPRPAEKDGAIRIEESAEETIRLNKIRQVT